MPRKPYLDFLEAELDQKIDIDACGRVPWSHQRLVAVAQIDAAPSRSSMTRIGQLRSGRSMGREGAVFVDGDAETSDTPTGGTVGTPPVRRLMIVGGWRGRQASAPPAAAKSQPVNRDRPPAA